MKMAPLVRRHVEGLDAENKMSPCDPRFPEQQRNKTWKISLCSSNRQLSSRAQYERHTLMPTVNCRYDGILEPSHVQARIIGEDVTQILVKVGGGDRNPSENPFS